MRLRRFSYCRLCTDIRERYSGMSAEEVLSSFEAYKVDMDNILSDSGVFIGQFPYEKFNGIHQRVVGIIPTGDPEKNGKIAERVSDGYKLGGKVLIKEKVSVYRLSESMKNAETSDKTD